MTNNKEIGVEAVNTMEGIAMNKEQEKYEIVATGSGEVTEKKADTLESEAVTMQKDTKDNDNMENMSLEGQEMGEMKDTYEIRKVTEDEKVLKTLTFSYNHTFTIKATTSDAAGDSTEETADEAEVTPTEEAADEAEVTPTEEAAEETEATPTEEAAEETEVTPTEEAADDTEE